MHTDRKIGFAMGILLIGIVAALFFRNEPLLSTRVSGIRRERELNQRLRERDVAVYLNDKEPDEVPEHTPSDQPWTLRDVLQKMDERNKTAPVPVGASSFAVHVSHDPADEELDGYRTPRKRPVTEAATVAEPLSPGSKVPGDEPGNIRALPPLMPDNSVQTDAVHSPSVGTPLVIDTSDPNVPVGSVTTSPDFQPPEHFEDYVVKYGDTLSGIAQRMLGSQKKYLDIYNANRDRMASPDRLEVGKPLRIPRVAESERSTY